MARRPGLALLVVALAGCLAGLVAGVRSGPLWLDETLSVEIAKVPLGSLVEALRVDGAPPVYYLLLKTWIAVAGDGTSAVRLLTVLMVPVALLLAFLLGRRLGGVGAARGAVIALAVLPWTLRYGSETRMYLLVVALVLGLALAVSSVWGSGSRRGVAAVAVLSGLLLLTHYWAFFLLAAVGLVFLIPAVRGSAPARRVVLGLVLGGVLFLPWLPVFLFQLAHTGAPWADPLEPIELLKTPRYWGGGSDVARGVLGMLVASIAGWVAWRVGVARWLVLVGGLTLLLAWTSVLLGGGAYTGRYTAVAVPLVAVAIGVGLAGSRWGLPALALLTAVGLGTGIPAASTPRASADGVVASFDRAGGAPGDLLAYCPDQLGPPVWRLLDPGVEQVVYPTFGDPRRVDWVDYKERQDAADPAAVARRLSGLAGQRRLFVLSATEYRTFEGDCEQLLATLTSLRGEPELLFGNAGTTGQLLHRFP